MRAFPQAGDSVANESGAPAHNHLSMRTRGASDSLMENRPVEILGRLWFVNVVNVVNA